MDVKGIESSEFGVKRPAFDAAVQAAQAAQLSNR